jgi:hypothetical protein
MSSVSFDIINLYFCIGINGLGALLSMASLYLIFRNPKFVIGKLVFATGFLAGVGSHTLATLHIAYLHVGNISGYVSIYGAVGNLFTDIVMISILLVVIHFLEIFSSLDERITRTTIIRLKIGVTAVFVPCFAAGFLVGFWDVENHLAGPIYQASFAFFSVFTVICDNVLLISLMKKVYEWKQNKTNNSPATQKTYQKLVALTIFLLVWDSLTILLYIWTAFVYTTSGAYFISFLNVCNSSPTLHLCLLIKFYLDLKELAISKKGKAKGPAIGPVETPNVLPFVDRTTVKMETVKMKTFLPS